MGIAAWEFVRIYKTGGVTPSAWLVYIGVILLVISRAVYNFTHTDGLLTLLVLCAMAFHLISYERGNDHAATDFSATICAIIYVGWMGAYFISLRNIPMVNGGFCWQFQPLVWQIQVHTLSEADLAGISSRRASALTKPGKVLSEKLFSALWVVYSWGTSGTSLVQQ
jgi:hypothetical protein